MKIIFCHNVHNRFKTLNNTIKIEKSIFPDSYSIIGYNVNSPLNELNGYDNVELIKFNGVTHKIGCTNGCITTIKAAMLHDPDVIVFSHDDVYLNTSAQYVNVFIHNANSIASDKCDAICRKPMPIEIYGDKYYLMEAFFISKRAAKKVFEDVECYSDESAISKDIRGSISPEVFLYETLTSKNLNVLEKKYEHKLENYNKTLSETMGYVHKNAGERGWTDN